MLDLLIVGGMVVDGSGDPGFVADVGIRDGRIVSIGPAEEPAARRINAAGLVVAPGFVDVHTHFDAQVFWDPALTPSCFHGVTTALGGNCGFTIAPIADEHAGYLMRMLAGVEGMPLPSLEAGVPWGKWRTFGEWLALLDGNVATNVGFLAGHSTIRRLAMGEASHDAQPSEAQAALMEAHLRDALAAGALGFSTSNGRSHMDGDGDVVPSRMAGFDEMVRLAAVVGEFPGTGLEYIPYSGAPGDEDRMTAMSRAARRPLNWNVLVVNSARGSAVDEDLAVSDRAAEAGARIVALENPAPLISRRSFLTAFGLVSLPGWGTVMTLPVPERIRALSDPDVRRRLYEGVAAGDDRWPDSLDFGGYLIEETFSADNEGYAGRYVGEVAASRGQHPFDAMLDIVVADELRTTLAIAENGRDEASRLRRAEAWRDSRVVLGASDAGAHLDTLALFLYTTHLLGQCVRERQLLTLEEAVHLLTDAPARLYGLKERGRVEVGWHADLVVFNPDTVAPKPIVTRHDLPAGAPRLYAEAEGVEHVIVNGTEIVTSGRITGEVPGTVLRSGRDTADVHV